MITLKPKILVCPLDWGIGHATRCVPVIEELIKQGAEVIIAADNRPYYFIKNEFPNLEIIRFTGFNVEYPTSNNMVIKMALSAPLIYYNIFKENLKLKKLISTYKIDAVISDNRFGLWSVKIPCVFITHQINIQSPFFETLINFLNRKIIEKYDECWIPDNENNLSGILSKNNSIKSTQSHLIGTLSRFKNSTKKTEKKYKITALISGPEPQRTILENILISQLKKAKIKSAIILGKTEVSGQHTFDENIDIFSHLPTIQLQEIIEDSDVIISRPGYSTIMDLAVLKKKAIFIPTPGQTEQEYLAKYLSEKGMGIFYKQAEFELEKCLPLLNKIGPINGFQNDLLKGKISSFLERIKGIKKEK
jgi:uncharacterized protein (TIGR00661 family)